MSHDHLAFERELANHVRAWLDDVLVDRSEAVVVFAFLKSKGWKPSAKRRGLDFSRPAPALIAAAKAHLSERRWKMLGVIDF